MGLYWLQILSQPFIWDGLRDLVFGYLKNLKKTRGGVSLLVILQSKPCSFTEVTLLYGFFSRFLNRTVGTKSRNASHI